MVKVIKDPSEEVRESIGSRRKAVLCAQEAAEYKAQNAVVLDVSELSSFADYFVICSGRSSRQVQGIADHIEESLRRRGIKPLGVEGQREGHWILMDYGDIIVHIFYEPIRRFYDLESLWSEAQRVAWETETEASAPHSLSE